MSLVVLMLATGASASSLPDGRGWELVSPVNTGTFGVAGIATLLGGDGISGGGVAQASADGNSVTFLSGAVVGKAAGAPLGNQYLSRRNLNGWQTTDISTPMVADSYSLVGNGTPYKAFSRDLGTGLLLSASGRPSRNPPLSPEEPEGYKNYYLATSLMSAFQPLVTENNASIFFARPGHPSNAEFNLEVAAASPDLRHIIIETTAALTSEASETGEENLYEWSEGHLSQLNLLPKGVPMAAARLGTTAFQEGVLSEDGNTVVLTEPGKEKTEEGKLYVRNVKAGVTREIDIGEKESEKGTGIYATASADGKTIFFTDEHKLTSDATAAGANDEDLYAYDCETGALVDLTTGDPSGAAVQGVLGASSDGRYVYFVANGVLNSTPNDHGALPVQGGDNLYVAEGGTDTKRPVIRFVTTLSPEDNNPANWTLETKGWAALDWTKGLADRTARISEDGHRAVFMSSGELTNYNNHDAVTGSADDEVYMYEMGSPGKLTCVSCRPDGTQPEGPSWIPGGTPIELGPEFKIALYRPRVLSESGQAFFDSDDGIVPTDTNHVEDVYEYESGHVALISSGTSSQNSSLIDASASGRDVFFTTAQSLVASDTNGLLDMYDARQPHVIGEVVSFPESAPEVACSDETCLASQSTPPVLGEPQSQAFIGAGEVISTTAARSMVKHKKRKRRPGRRRRRTAKRTKSHTSIRGSHGRPRGKKSALKGRG